MSIARNSSTNNGLPSAAAVRRVLTARAKALGRHQVRDQSARRSGAQRLERIVVAFLSALTPPRASVEELGASAGQQRIGVSRLRSAMCSMRSSKVGSAQWMSSMTTIRGRSPRAARGVCGRPERPLPAA